MNVRQILKGVLLAGACLGASCGPSAPRTTDAVPAATPSAAAQPPADSRAATAAGIVPASPGKPTAPIAFDYTILGTPVAGQPLDIELGAGAEAALAELNVALAGNERLVVPIEAARLRFAAVLAAGQRARQTVRVTPVAAGTVYLDVLLEAEIDGRLQSRAVTIPIRVADGGAPEPPIGTLSSDAEGAPIISLPGRTGSE